MEYKQIIKVLNHTQSDKSLLGNDIDFNEKSAKNLFDVFSIFNNALIVAIIDSNGIIQYVNDELLQVFNFSNQDDLVGLKYSNIVENDLFHDIDRVKNLIHSNKIWEGITKHISKSKEVIWLKTKVTPNYKSDGSFDSYMIIAQNISNEYNEILNRNEFEKRLNSLVNSTVNAYFLLNENRELIAYNKTAYKDIKKYIHKELRLNTKIYDYLFFLDEETFEINFQSALDGEFKSIQNLVNINNREVWFKIDFKHIEEDFLSVGISLSYEDITLQKHYEQNLKKEKEKFRNILNTAPTGILLIDLDNYRILSSNPVAQKILEYKENELAGLSLKVITHSDDVTKEQRHLKKILTNGYDKIEFNKRLLNKNNKIIYTNNVITKIEDDDEINSGIILFTDITNKYKDQIIKSFLHDLSVAVNSTRDLNELYQIIHRYLSNVLDTKNFYIALYDERKNLISFPYLIDEYEDDTPIINATESGSITANVINMRSPLLIKKDDIQRIYGTDDDLGEIPEVWLGAPLMIKNKVIGAIAVQNYDDPDIYDHRDLYLFESLSNQVARAIEIKLREREILHLKAGIDQNANEVIILDKDCYIEYANQIFYKNNNTTKNNVIGKIYKDYFSRVENCCDLYSKMIDSVKNGKIWKSDIKNINSNKDTIWEAVTAIPLKDEDNSITNFLINKEDITERKRIYKELKDSKDEAEKLSNFKSNVLSNLSHELRTPLNGILGFAQILQNEIQDEETKDFVKMIDESSHRLLNTLNSLLTLSTLESGDYKIVKNFINLDEIVEFSLIQFKNRIEEKNIELKISKRHNNLNILTDENIVSQIFKEIVDNAIKYTDYGKTIKIIIDKTLFNDMPSLCISVIDKGPGIDKEKIDLIFEAFRQGSEGINRTYEGMGLGLTIAYKMSKLIGANISIQSELNEGSTFTICFPE